MSVVASTLRSILLKSLKALLGAEASVSLALFNELLGIGVIVKADQRIIEAARKMREGNYPKEGLSFAAHLVGLFGQRL